MNNSSKLLSDIVAFRTYAKFLPEKQRRETLEETITRNMDMHISRFPQIESDIREAYKQVYSLNIMPSMRSMQFAGEAILKNNVRIYNCSFLHINKPRAFAETLYVLLCGTGAGYSVQNRHISQLPKIRKPKRANIHMVHDSIEGWADAVDALMNSYFFGGIKPLFDYSQISRQGTLLGTTGAKAPGPKPLIKALDLVNLKLSRAIDRRLTSLEIHDIICILADCVLAGGIRRAALISLFDKNDESMLTCKHGDWWNESPYRARANNSAALLRKDTTREEFDRIYEACINSNCGEPGFIWTDDLDMGKNPCAEIGLNPNQFCNLTTINLTTVVDSYDFLQRVQAAALIGTLQAAYTDFPYLSHLWKEMTEFEALLGVSFTGVADGIKLSAETIQEGAKLVNEINATYAKILGINPSARSTAIKPEGSASCVLGSSSGIHARHSDFYLRRIRINKEESLAKYLITVIPDLCEIDFYSDRDIVVTIPQKSPEGSVTRETETALQLLERVLFYNKNWVKPGFVHGKDQHNVSCTINYKKEEVKDLQKALWENREVYSGISLLPHDGGTYKQAPFESCDESTYLRLSELVKDIDLTKVTETEDQTDLAEQLSCVGGVCEIK